MKAAIKMSEVQKNIIIKPADTRKIETLVKESWSKIAPTWPLKSLIAVNPLAGFEDMSFEDALREGKAYFQAVDLPEKMQDVNRQSIKWLQALRRCCLLIAALL